MAQNQPSSTDARMEVARQAALKPRNLAIGGGLVVLGVILTPALIFLAVLVFAGLVAFDVATAERLPAGQAQPGALPGRANPQQYAPEIAAELQRAQMTERAIVQAIEASDHPFEELRDDVAQIVSQMETSAKRAQMIKDTLDDQARHGNDDRSIQQQIEKLRPRFNQDRDVRELVNDLEAQRRSHLTLRESLEKFTLSMARLNASLGLMRNRLVEMSAAEEEALQAELAAQARDLRDRTERSTRVILETSAPAGGDDLQRELDRDAAEKGLPKPKPTDERREIPMRNRATPQPKPAPPAPRPQTSAPRPDPAPAPPKPKAPPKPDGGPYPINLPNRAKPAAPDMRHPRRDGNQNR